MMIQEFEQLTGIYPTTELYKVIEEQYMNGPWSNKQEFCKAYKKNTDGLAKRCARRANGARLAAEMLAEQDVEKWKKTAEQWKAEVDRVQRHLDRELAWTAYEDQHRISEKDYKRLAAQTDTKALTTEEARDLVALEFGFDRERITIMQETPVMEVNKYHQIRRTGRSLRRAPLYNASDWNFVSFEICGYSYEMVNGELNRV